MAQFEEKYPIDAFKVYRPSESAKVNAKAWWRYAILAEVYKVRCLQREEMWRVAGNNGMNILSHIRFIIAQKGNMDNMDQEVVNENYVADMMRKLKSLEHVVSDLDRENMALRKMIKTLFTPLAKENFVSDELTLQDIEQEIDILESRALTTTKRLAFEEFANSPESIKSTGTKSYRLGGSMEADDLEAEEYQLLDSLASSVDTPDLNIRSPYENLLPPIEMTQRDMQDPKSVSRKNKGGSPKSPRLKPINPKDKFPSYLEREAMRKEQAAKKKERINMMKAERILKAAIEKEEAEAAAALNGGPKEPTSELTSAEASNAPPPKQPKQKAHKPLQQPQWVDDFKMPDLAIGRGKGKPKEDPPPQKTHHKRTSDSTVADSQAEAVPQTKQKILPKATEDMSSGQKITVELIAKARNKMMSAEEAAKPLSNLEINLLKSPLALPVAKLPAGVVMVSPRERAIRSNASPRVNSFNFAPKKKDSPRGSESGAGGSGGDSGEASSGAVDTEVNVKASSSNHMPAIAGAAPSSSSGGVPNGKASTTSAGGHSASNSGSNSVNHSAPVSARENNTDDAKVPPVKKSPREPSRVSPRENARQEPSKAAPKRSPSPSVAPQSLSPRGNPAAKDGSASMAAINPGGSGASSGKTSNASLTLTSQSAPASVVSSRTVPPVDMSPAQSPRNPKILAMMDELDGPSPLPSPAESDKLKKKNILKSLNERSNPNSPRQPGADSPLNSPVSKPVRPDSADSADEDRVTMRPQIDFGELDTLVASISTASLDAAVA